MKNPIGIITCAFFLVTSAGAFAQEKTTAGQDIKQAGKSTGKAVEKAATAVGQKTAEVASKGAAKVTAKTYQDKVGPDGQTIYIDSHSKYYFVNKKGEHIYVAKAQLKDK